MSFFPSIVTILMLSEASLMSSFLINTNPPLSLNSTGPSNGFDSNIINNLLEKVNRLELQNQEQNKTLEAQDKIIHQLLNFTQQTPSTVSLSNDLSILQMYVRRIMDEYHRLSNISDITHLALKIDSIVNSFKTLTSSLTTQENKMTQMNNEFYQFKQKLSELNGTFSSGVQQAINNALNQTTSTQSLQNEISVVEMNVQRIFDEYHKLTTIANTTYLADKISTLVNTVRGISTSLIEHENSIALLNRTLWGTSQSLQQLFLETNANSSNQQSLSTISSRVLTNEQQQAALTNEIQTAKHDIGILQNSVSQNQRNVTNQISSLSSKHQNEVSTLKNNLHSCESKLNSLENIVSQNQQQITSLNTHYSLLSETLSSLDAHIGSMDNCLDNYGKLF